MAQGNAGGVVEGGGVPVNWYLVIGGARIALGDLFAGVLGMVIALILTVWSWQALHVWLQRLDDWRDGYPQQPFFPGLAWLRRAPAPRPALARQKPLSYNEQALVDARRRDGRP